MKSRYELWQPWIINFSSSKFVNFVAKTPISLKKVNANAGLYKPNALFSQHSLILASITGLAPITKFQMHGKRQKRTVLVGVKLEKQYIWPFLDKYVHELLQYISDFKTPKFNKGKNQLNNVYSLRLRHKLGSFDDFNDLISTVMHDSYKGIFLPLTAHFQLNQKSSHMRNETYLRMLRLPVTMYKRHMKPAFDDKVVFAQAL